jgi:endonuclease III
MLGNKEDPLDELIFIILSNKSREQIYFGTFDALKRRFATWDEAAEAPVAEIAETIRFGGLADKKSRAIKLLLEAIVTEIGRADLSSLHELDDASAEAFLRGLPGVGSKTARCVLSVVLQRCGRAE